MTSATIDRRMGLSGNTAFKAPADLATTGNITLNGEQTIDGTLTSGSRVLVWQQTNAVQNGLYDSDSGAWTRCKDADDSRDLAKGTRVAIASGTASAGVVYQCTTANPVPGSTAISFQVDSSATSLRADLASPASGKGAALVGSNDAGGYFTGDNAELILQEIGRSRKLQEVYVDVTADGSDQNTAVQAYLALAKSIGVPLRFPAGIIGFSDTLIIDFPAVILGAGRDKTTLRFINSTAGKSAVKFIRNSRRSTVSNLTLADGTFGTSCGIELIDSLGGTGTPVQKVTFIDVEVDCFAIGHKYTSAVPLTGATHSMCSETLWLHCRFCNNILSGLNQNCQAVNNLYVGTDFENFDTTYLGSPVTDSNFQFFKDEAGCGISVQGGSMVGRGKWFSWEYKTGGTTLFSGAQFSIIGVRVEARTTHVGTCVFEEVHGVNGSLSIDITLRDIEVVAFSQTLDLLRYGGRLDLTVDNVNPVQGTGSLTIRQYPTLGRTSGATTGTQGIGRIHDSDIDVVVETTSAYGTFNSNATGLVMRDGCVSSSTNSSMATDAQGFFGVVGKGNSQQMGMQLNDAVMPKMLIWNNDNPGNTVSGDVKILVPKGGRPLELVVFKQPQAVAGDSGWELYVVKDNANWANPAVFAIGTDATLVATTGVTTNKAGFFRVPVVLTVAGFTGAELRAGKTGWLEGRMYLKKTGATAFPGWFGIEYL